MQAKTKFTKYSINIFEKTPVLSWLHQRRLLLVGRQIKKSNAKNILEIGCYDLYAYQWFLQNNFITKEQHFTGLDAYADGLQEKITIKLAEKNTQELKKRGANINLVSALCEEMKLKEKYDTIVAMETIEHVIDENKSIANIAKTLNKNGKVIISVPVEKYVFFFFKELARMVRFPTRENASVKELFFGLIGKTSKIKRVPRAHKGYDHKNTIKLFKENNIAITKKRFYPLPCAFLAYGVVLELEKN